MWQLAALLGIGLGILNHKDRFGSEAPEFPIQPFDARYSEKESSDDWAMRQKGYQSMRFENNYDAEQVPSRKVRSISGKSVKLRRLNKDRNLQPKEARERLEISAESFEAQSPNFGKKYGYKCDVCRKPIKEGVNLQDIDVHWYIKNGDFTGDYELKNHLGNYNNFYCYTCAENEGFMSEEGNTPNSRPHRFEASVLRGKPKGYVGKVLANDKMLRESDLEQMMLELESAVRLGLISEEEIMRQLQEKFGSEEYAGNYMVPADIKSIARSVATLQKKAKADQNTPEWWKSKLSVVAAELDDLTDFFDYAEDAGML
jgi:hypothetical protein